MSIQKTIKLFSEDDKKYNIIIYISVNFRFMEDIIKQLETRKMTSFQNLGLIDEVIDNIKHVGSGFF